MSQILRLQNFIEPDADSPELFVRREESGELSTGTYFNAFSVGKWVQYTTLSNLRLCVQARGQLLLRVYYACLDDALQGTSVTKDGESFPKVGRKMPARQGLGQSAACSKNGFTQELVAEKVFYSEEAEEACFALPLRKKGVFFYRIQKQSPGSSVVKAWYETECSATQRVRLALNICTYRRQEALFHNLSLLQEAFLKSSTFGERGSQDAAAMENPIEIFITDNASELSLEQFSDPRIHLRSNRNLGGAGGFACGLMEIKKRNAAHPDKPYTHILFLDDDAVVFPESIRRMICLLRLLRPELQKAFFAGAMLRKEEPSIQHENGALWNAGKSRYCNRGMDMRRMENLLQNEETLIRDYAAWWYCCVPMAAPQKSDLPVPVFLHGDDIEFSLRYAAGILSMNGIAVRHPASPHRRLSTNEYYNLRNLLILNAQYCPEYGVGQALHQILTALLVALCRHRYRDMRLIRKAVLDYLRGPEWLMNADEETLHQEIVKMGYQLADVSDALASPDVINHTALPKKTGDSEAENRGFRYLWQQANTLWKRLGVAGRLVSLNGRLLPARRSTDAFFMNVHPAELFRTSQIILYDDADQKGLKLQKKGGQFLVLLAYMAELTAHLLLRQKSVNRSYRARWEDMTSQEFWEKHL